jgi:hypothetical protein
LASTTASIEAVEATDAPKGPPVSKEHLNAWFDVYSPSQSADVASSAGRLDANS